MTVDELIAALTKLRDEDPEVGALEVETQCMGEYCGPTYPRGPGEVLYDNHFKTRVVVI